MINERKAKEKCCEDISLIENYDKAVADTTQTWHCHHRLGVRDGKTVTDELKANGMYEHRPACELIFVTPSQHAKLHYDLRSKAGKNGNCADKVRAGKLGCKKQPREAKVRGGKNGGVKGGKKMRGKKWWNNGIVGTRAFECPGDGWVRGRLKRSSVDV